MTVQNPTIPEEIQNEIINHLCYPMDQVGPKDLLNYVLTSKTWLTLVRRAYFKQKDVIIGNHRPGSFRRVLTPERANDPRSTIAPYVRVVAVIGPDPHRPWLEPPNYYRFGRAVCETTRPIRLQIVDLSISSLTWSRLTQETIQAFSSFPHVKKLRIYGATFGDISELTDFITPTNLPELQHLAVYQSQFGDGRPVTQALTRSWLWTLKNQECQITGLSLGTLQNREQEDAVKGIIRIVGSKLERLSVDYVLSPESDRPPLLLEENSNLRTLRIGTFSALSRSSNAIRPLCALIDSITSITMTSFEFVIEFPQGSAPNILAEAREWVQVEDKLVRHQERQGSTRVHWMLDILRPEEGVKTMPIQLAFRRIFRKLHSTGRFSLKSNERLGEKGFEVWM